MARDEQCLLRLKGGDWRRPFEAIYDLSKVINGLQIHCLSPI
jgi:hypothetical protein